MTDDPHRVLLIGGSAQLVRKAHGLGLDVVIAQFPRAFDEAVRPHVEQALLVDYLDVDRLLPRVRELHRSRPFGAVLSLSELGLLPAARIGQELGLSGTTVTTAELLTDKWRMRRLLAERGLSPVAAGVGRSVRDLEEFVDAHGLPVILKPVRESGSLGVFTVRDRADVPDVAARFRSLREKQWVAGDLAFPDSFDEFLIEEFLDGPEISVETLSHHGRHVVVAVTDKETAGFVEVGHAQPSRCPADALGEATRLVTGLLDAAGLRDGPAHTEVKLTARGPRIVESHNRIGGGRINELTEIAYGVDMERYALGVPFGLVEPLVARPEPRAGAAVSVITPAPGRVEEVLGLEAVRADPACVDVRLTVGPGAEVPPLTWNEDKVGHVVARGATAAEAAAQAERLAAMVRVRTRPVR
jgi:biotin carboxylase